MPIIFATIVFVDAERHYTMAHPPPPARFAACFCFVLMLRRLLAMLFRARHICRRAYIRRHAKDETFMILFFCRRFHDAFHQRTANHAAHARLFFVRLPPRAQQPIARAGKPARAASRGHDTHGAAQQYVARYRDGECQRAAAARGRGLARAIRKAAAAYEEAVRYICAP